MNPLFAAGLTSWDVFLHFPIMMILVNFIFSATRYDDWQHIWHHAIRGMVYIITFLGGVFVFLLALQIIIPKIFS